jgi:hypothetical protein
MRARLALTLVAAAFALAAPANAAPDTCVGNGPAGACVHYECIDHHCIQREWTVYTYCQHPVPPQYCTILGVSVTVPR